jgi:LysR family transcriptional regulator AphB
MVGFRTLHYQMQQWHGLIQFWDNEMDLNDIALFVHVVRAGSFAEAGRRLGIPPSTGSRRLQALERMLGVRLLQRSTRRLALTDAGQAFFNQCAEKIDALAQSAQEMADRSKPPSGRVRVAAGVDFLNWFPMERIAGFLARYPDVRLEFELSDTRADLLSDSIDVALRAGKMVEPTPVARQVGWVHWRLVASPAYVAAHGVPVAPADLAGHQCIVSPPRDGVPVAWQLSGPDGVAEVAVDGHFQANTLQAQLRGALAGLGIALLPALVAAEHIQQGSLLTMLPAHGLDVEIHFVYPSRRHIPRAVGAFTEFATAVMLETGIMKNLA